MATTTSQLMTVAEFSNLPEDAGSYIHELRNGEVVPVVRAKYKHYKIQHKLRRFLENLAP